MIDLRTNGVDCTKIVFSGLVLIIKANALPPPPPDMFSNDALFNIPDLVNASPVPLAVPSQPPPAPPPITKCNLSIAKLVDEIEVIRTVAKTKLVNFFKLLNILSPFLSYLIKG